MIYFMLMKEFIRSGVLAGVITAAPIIGYESDVELDLPNMDTHTHQLHTSEHSNSSFELDDLSNGLKIAITLAGISLVAGKYASTKRFTMHSEPDEVRAAWASFAAITAATAVVILDTWTQIDLF